MKPSSHFVFDVISIGTAVLDVYLKGFKNTVIRVPEFTTQKGLAVPYGGKEKVDEIEYHVGGGAINTALTFAQQDLHTGLICRVNTDFAGDHILKSLKPYRYLYTNWIQIDSKLSTAGSYILLPQEGERSILSYKGCGLNLTLEALKKQEIGTKALFVSSLGGNKKLLKQVIEFKKHHPGILLASNPGGLELDFLRRHPEWLRYYDILIINQEEAAYLSRLPYLKTKKLLNWFARRVDGIFLMTQGVGGASILQKNDRWHMGALKKLKIADSTGAGDAFASAFTVAYLQRKTLEHALKFSTLSAASVLESIGANKGVLTPKVIKKPLWKKRWKQLKLKSLSK